MTLFEIANIAAVIVGPVAAVGITLWYQARSERRKKEYELFQTVWDTHHDASVPQYSQAIRLIPIVFNKSSRIREAWNRYMRNVGQKPAPENAAVHEKEFLDAKNDLIAAIATRVGIRVSDRAIRDSIYIATSYTERLILSKNAEEAQLRIADALEKNNEFLKNIKSGDNNAQKN